MITLKYFGDHLKELRKLLWTSRSSSESGDVHLVSQDGTAHQAHRLLLVALLPSLAPLLAPSCGGNHEESVTIILSEVGNTVVKAALEDLYTKGDPKKMANILGNISAMGSAGHLEEIFKNEIDDQNQEEIIGDVENTIIAGHVAPAGEKEVDEEDAIKISEEDEEMVERLKKEEIVSRTSRGLKRNMEGDDDDTDDMSEKEEGDQSDNEEGVAPKTIKKQKKVHRKSAEGPFLRGKDRVWRELASFPNTDQFRASDIQIELSSEMTRHTIYKGEDCHNHLYDCRYFKKKGWKRCHRAVRVGFSQNSFEIFVWETDDQHIHEEEPGFVTPVNYHWTPEQCQAIRRHIQFRSTRINLILQELRDQNLVNGTGLLPTKDQVASNVI